MRRGALKGLILTLGLLAPPPASAQVVSAEASMSPGTLRPPLAQRVEYRFDFVTGEAPAAFPLDTRQPSVGHGVVGAPVRLGSPTLTGPGKISAYLTGGPAYGEGTCFRGPEPDRLMSLRLELPARSRTTLVFPGRLARIFPWPRTEYRLGLRMGRRLLRARRPAVRGRVAPDVILTSPNELIGRAEKGPRTVHITGRTRPALRRKILTLDLSGARSAGDLTRIARVRTDGRGRFLYSRFFSRPGRYSVTAAYRGSRRLAPIRSCPGAFAIGPLRD